MGAVGTRPAFFTVTAIAMDSPGFAEGVTRTDATVRSARGAGAADAAGTRTDARQAAADTRAVLGPGHSPPRTVAIFVRFMS
ncbi:hypothetical protein ASG94_17395 [Nocardioides sp. Soil805]|nr:hypothetical protein ASG94_17395 [Nocardioides sp. Soil805]